MQLQKESDGYHLVKVEGAGIYERTYSGNSDGTEMEFRIPLVPLGLAGHGKNIQFNIKADIRQDFPKQDWVYDEGPIYDTKGPVFGAFTGLILFIGVLFVAKCYKQHRGQFNKKGEESILFTFFIGDLKV